MEEKELQDFSIFFPNDSRTYKGFIRHLSDLEYGIIKSGAHSKTAKFVNKCMDDTYSEIFWKGGGSDEENIQCRKMQDNDIPIYIRLSDVGEGIKRAIVILLLLESISPHIVLWDDFGSAEHPSLIRNELEWLGQKGWQVFLVTHSIDVLYELLQAEISDVSILQISKSKNDALVYNSLSIDELDNLIGANTDPRFPVDALGGHNQEIQ